MTKPELYAKLYEQAETLEQLHEIHPLTPENQRRLDHIKQLMADIEFEI